MKKPKYRARRKCKVTFCSLFLLNITLFNSKIAQRVWLNVQSAQVTFGIIIEILFNIFIKNTGMFYK
jgi:hypothetical protein